MTIEQRIAMLKLVLPPPLVVPAGARLPFVQVHVVGTRALVSGHGPQAPDGTIAQPLGKVGRELTLEQGIAAAQLATLSLLASLQRELGDLERVQRWVRVFGMVNSAPGFVQQPTVLNGCSDLLLKIYGPERGRHARTAVGVAELPFGFPVEIEAEVEIAS